MTTPSVRLEQWATTNSVCPLVALEMFLERAAIIAEATGQSAHASEQAAMADMEAHPECYRAGATGSRPKR